MSRKIKKLEKKGYIFIEYKRRGAEITAREIRITRLTKRSTDDRQKDQPTIDENVKDNNISNNNIINNKEKTKTKKTYTSEFEEVWDLYERRGSKAEAFPAWKKLSDEEKVLVKNNIQEYKESVTGEKFMKHFKRYLTFRLFEESHPQDPNSPFISKNKKDKWADNPDLPF